jgi:hypothetical protein
MIPETGDRPAQGWPVLVSGTAMPLDPSESLMRREAGAWIEQGYVVLFPQRKGDGFGDPDRNPFHARDLLPSMIGMLEILTPIDRDRIVFSPPWWAHVNATDVHVPTVDATPYMGLHLCLVGGSNLGLFRNGEHYARKAALIHHGEFFGDTVPLATARLHWLKFQSVATLNDPNLNFPERATIDSKAPLHFLERRRLPPPETLQLITVRNQESRNEWLETAGSSAPSRLFATRSGTTLDLTTPEAPDSAVFPLNIYWQDHTTDITIRLNEKPIFGGTVPASREQELLCLRYRLLTGRTAARVVRIRP